MNKAAINKRMFKFLCEKIKSSLGIKSGVVADHVWIFFTLIHVSLHMWGDADVQGYTSHGAFEQVQGFDPLLPLCAFVHGLNLNLQVWQLFFEPFFLDLKENYTFITVVASPVYIQFTCSFKLTMNKDCCVPISSPAFLVLRQLQCFLSFFSFLLYSFFIF